ncbi:MAG: hypothetical protein K8R48_00925 [Alphaproteobacteria bacterium]|nr:hypothetical protein [Alphaproteobacteria bacterium]
MNTALKTSSHQYADIARIIHGKPAASLSKLPAIWQAIAQGAGNTLLSELARHDYVEAAQLFRHHGTPLAMEALDAIGHDFDRAAYPDFGSALQSAGTDAAQMAVRGVQALFDEFGYAVPASFYNVILATALRDDAEVLMDMFKDKKQLLRDRLWDAVLHAMLLVTPIGLHVQSVLSQHGLRFTHVMNCGCNIAPSADVPFSIGLDAVLKPAYLQNLLAAAFEQYGVNATTARSGRGF